MNLSTFTTYLLAVFLLSACSENKIVIEVGSVTLTLPGKMVSDLQSQSTINEQLTLLYEAFEPQLDRSDDIAGPDENQDGIRDDIEAYIEALQVKDPIRTVIKQNARNLQSVMTNDFSKENNKTLELAYNLKLNSRKIEACYFARGVELNDLSNLISSLEALTTDTKSRALQYSTFIDHVNDGELEHFEGEEYCE
ncbi:chromosome partitioning protein ParA [Vibrio sp. RC27]